MKARSFRFWPKKENDTNPDDGRIIKLIKPTPPKKTYLSVALNLLVDELTRATLFSQHATTSHQIAIVFFFFFFKEDYSWR